MLSRLSAVRRLPRTFALRYYTNGRTEGSVAQSQGFRYIHPQRIHPKVIWTKHHLKYVLAKKKKLMKVNEFLLIFS